MMKKRRLCIVTGSRADWGLFYPLATEIKKNRDIFTLQIIATGGHLSRRFGETYREIERDGFKIDRKVKILLSKDTGKAVAGSVGVGITGLSKALDALKPELVFLLGDRFETFAASIACLFLKIPIAHIHGGELTEGSIDEKMRHAITKMATLHFVSTEEYKRRVVQMGESPSRVFNVRALGLDNIKRARLLNKGELERRLSFRFRDKNIMITFHPSTAEDKRVSIDDFKDLLKVADSIDDTMIIFTKPNPDMYSKAIARLIDDYVSRNSDKAVSFSSLGRILYLSMLQFVDVVAGNSSSGIIEAPSFGIPTINIGNRQKGRVKGDTVIDVKGGNVPIKRAFDTVFSRKKKYRSSNNPYGDGNTAKKIVAVVKKTANIYSKKSFFDLDFNTALMRKIRKEK